jgi:hypothetical protein
MLFMLFQYAAHDENLDYYLADTNVYWLLLLIINFSLTSGSKITRNVGEKEGITDTLIPIA